MVYDSDIASIYNTRRFWEVPETYWDKKCLGGATLLYSDNFMSCVDIAYNVWLSIALFSWYILTMANKHFFKTLLIFSGMILVGLLGVYLINYFDEGGTVTGAKVPTTKTIKEVAN